MDIGVPNSNCHAGLEEDTARPKRACTNVTVVRAVLVLVLTEINQRFQHFFTLSNTKTSTFGIEIAQK